MDTSTLGAVSCVATVGGSADQRTGGAFKSRCELVSQAMGRHRCRDGNTQQAGKPAQPAHQCQHAGDPSGERCTQVGASCCQRPKGSLVP